MRIHRLRLILSATAALALVVCGGSVNAGTIIVNDSFADGNRFATGTSGSDIETNFFATSTGSAIEDDNDDGIGAGAVGLVSGTSGRQIHAVFPSTTLAAAGDKIQSSVTFTTPAVSGNNLFSQADFDALDPAVQDGASLSAFPTTGDDLRIGLFSSNSAGLNLSTDLSNNSSTQIPELLLAGYAVELDVEPSGSASTTDIQLREYLLANATGNLLGTNTGSSSVATDGSTGQYFFQPSTQYELVQSYTLNAAGGLDVAVTFIEAGVTLGTLTSTETAPTTLEFSILALGASSEAFGLSNDAGDPENGIDINNVTIHTEIVEATAVPEPGTLSILFGGMTLAMLRRRR